jgi:hypothetical protein
MIRNDPLFSLCGLNCCLCPRFNAEGSSRCPGCGGEGFALKHPTCAVSTCNKKHDNVEYCFQCSAYPCKKYAVESSCDSFISYKSVKQNFAEAASDLGRYRKELDRRHEILRSLLEGYNDGRSKGLYCLAANDMPMEQLEGLYKKAEALPRGMDAKEMAKELKGEIAKIASELGVEFKLRRERP